MHMDFANYTVGGLVRARQLYDNDHPEYRKVMGQLRWRMYDLGDLGYRFDVFGELDTRTETVALMASVWTVACSEGDHEPQLRPAEADLDASFPDPPRSLRVVSSSRLPDQLTIR
jgi:hypothetical protein